MPDYQEYKEQMCIKHFGIETVNTEHPNFLIYLRDMQYAPANNEPIHDDDEEPELDWIDLDCMRYHSRKDD